MTDTPLSPDDGMLAAEYALGLLEDDEARAAAARVLTDAGFAAEVRFWQERLAGLADEIAPAAVSPALKRRLMRRLFGAEERRWWQAAWLWQGATALSLAAAAFLAVEVARFDRVPTLYTAELVSEDGALRVLAVYDSVTGHIRVTRTDGAAAQGRDLELWAIGGDGVPVPVGVLPDDEVRAGYEVPEAVRAALATLTLAISDEPDGGSPTGQPTGAILAVGQVSEI